jgi:hypothetical protein
VRAKRQLVTAVVVVGAVGLFVWEWTAAPRVEASPQVRQRLTRERGRLFLGQTFEGLPLRTVRPFVYSDCIPGRPHVTPCTVVRVQNGRITGSDPKQVARARARLRRVP